MASSIGAANTNVQNGLMNSKIISENRVGLRRSRCKRAESKFAHFQVLDICMLFTSVKSSSACFISYGLALAFSHQTSFEKFEKLRRNEAP